MKLRIFLIALFFTNSSAFANLSNAEKVFSAGKWTVLRDIDKMTDKIDCTGVQSKDYGIQLTPNSLFITVKGGISGVKMRFDDAPVLSFRFGEEIEKKIGSIILKGNDLSVALASKRLRMQVSTLIAGVAEFDIDLNGIDVAMQNINEGCPIPEINNVLSITPATMATPSFSCGKNLIERLLKTGVSKRQINQICTP